MPPISQLARSAKHRAFLLRLDIEKRVAARSRRRDPAFVSHMESVARGFALPALPHHRGPWAIAMVRNESDIIEMAVRHLSRQGIERILIVDNLSTDDTLSRLRDLALEFPALVIGTDCEPAYYQSEKMTHLADLAGRAGATWIIPFDADEMWFAASGTLAEALARSPKPLQRAHIYNAFPSADGSRWRLDTQRHFDDKIAFRPGGGAVIEMGNHDVLRAGMRGDELRILHLPWRSFEQFARKTRVGAAAVALADLPEDKAYHWRWLGRATDEELRSVWRELLAGQAGPNVAWYPRGSLVDLERIPPRTWDELSGLMPPESASAPSAG